MPSPDEPHAIIHEKILPRMDLIEKKQEQLHQSYIAMENRMDTITNQMKAMELSNNDLKQTVVGYGQSHSMLLTKSMESQIETVKSLSSVFQEVKSAKEQTSQVKEKIEAEKVVAKLSVWEKIFVAVIGSPGILLGLEYIVSKFK